MAQKEIFRAVAAVGLLAAAVMAPAHARTQPVMAKHAVLDSVIPPLLKRHKIPSVSIARIRGGKIDLVVAYGEQAPGVPATPHSLYNVASLTKPVTAETVLRLASKGLLSIDDRMADVWTDPDIATDERRLLLTPRIALSHQTGFANWRRMTGGVLKFQFTPGTKFGYSGEGFEYLGRYTARKAGQSLDVLAQREVFDPLGMRETTYIGKPWLTGRIALPSSDGKWLEPSIAKEAIASDELYTSAHDYAQFLEAVIAGRGLSPDLARQRITIQIDQTADNCNAKFPQTCPVSSGFGLGWQVFNFRTKTFLMHTGNDRGEFTFAYWSPTTREGAVILTNSNDGSKLLLDALDSFGFDPEFTAFLKALAAK